MNPYNAAALHNESRRCTSRQKIAPLLHRYKCHICQRFNPSVATAPVKDCTSPHRYKCRTCQKFKDPGGQIHAQLLFARNIHLLQSSKFSFQYLLQPPRSALEASMTTYQFSSLSQEAAERASPGHEIGGFFDLEA